MTSFSSIQAEEALQQIRPPALGHDTAHHFASALATGDVTAAYAAFSDAGTWEDRWFCLEHVAAETIDQELIDAWVEGWPDHPLPLLVRAARDVFANRPASQDLARAIAMEPESPVGPGLQVIDVANGGAGDIEAAFGRMLAIGSLYEPHVHFLQAQGPRGGGDLEALVAFARSVDDVVAPGSPLKAMVPLAAVEVLLADQPEDHLANLARHGLIDTIMMSAGQSVFHPEFIGPPSVPAIKAMTAFAVMLVLLHEDDLALTLHRRLAGVFADWPLLLVCEPGTEGWNQLGRHMEDNGPHAAMAGGRA
jgi:hypothetical protein